MKSRRTIRIFVSSPNDVAEERSRAKTVIELLQREYQNRAILVPVMWEHLSFPASASFQEGIQHLISEAHRVDIAVFILWSRLGSPLGDAIKKRDGSPYRSGTEHEFDLMLSAYEQSGKVAPYILAYTRDDEGFSEPLAKVRGVDALQEIVNQRRLVEDFIKENFHDKQGRNVRAYYTYKEPVGFAQRLRDHLRLQIDAILGLDPTNAVWENNPYRSLDAFDIEHSPIFYGRNKEVHDLLDRLRDQRKAGCEFACIVGASGAGKSSLARAGVAATLLHDSCDDTVKGWRALIFLPSLAGKELLSTLALQIAEKVPELSEGVGGVNRFIKRFSENLEAASDLLEAALQIAGTREGGSIRLLLVVDQMEELWTGTNSEDDIERFLCALEVLGKSEHVCILATLRSDFYPKAQLSQAFLRLKGERGHFDLVPPGPAALSDIIVQPARRAGYGFERDDRTGRTLDQMILEDASRDPGALPLLQYALSQLFEQSREKSSLKDPPAGDRNLLTLEAYEALGGVEGALSKKINETFDSLPQDSVKALDELLPMLISVDITTEQASRRRAVLAVLKATDQRKQVTEALVAARFLTTDVDVNEGIRTPVAAFAHEALLRRWERLAKWIISHKKDLCTCTAIRSDARVWKENTKQVKSKDVSYLYPKGHQLDEAQRLLESGFLESDEQEFIQASIQAVAEQEFRYFLATDKDDLANALPFSQQLESHHPEIRLKVIHELLDSKDETTRRNTAMLLGKVPPTRYSHKLVDLVVHDLSETVRRAAAWSLLRLDDITLYDEIAGQCKDQKETSPHLLGLTHLLVAADMQTEAPNFDQWYSRLPKPLRVKIRICSWMMRVKMAIPVFLAVTIPATALSVISAMLFKWLPGYFNYAYGQADPSSVMSLFHAATAAILIGGSATFGLSFYRMVFGREHGTFSYFKPFGAVIAGAILGAFGGMLCTAAIAGVFLPEGLSVMGWMEMDEPSKPPFFDFCRLLFIENRCGLIFTLNGMGVGIGMAMMTNRLRGCRIWDEFLQTQSASKMSEFGQAFRILKSLTRIAFSRCWPIPASLFITSTIGILLLCTTAKPMPESPHDWPGILWGGMQKVDKKAPDIKSATREQRLALHNWKTSLTGRLFGIAGDSTAKVIGAFFAVVGMGFGIVILRSGISVEARKRVG